MNCKKCGDYFSSSVVIEGKKHNLSKRKYCLDCSPFGFRNTRRLENIMENKKKCVWCEEIKLTSDFDFRWEENQSHTLRSVCKKCLVEYNKERQDKIGKDRKLKIISERGGKCIKCGYNKNWAVLCFHHRNPEDKTFELDRRGFGSRSEASCLDEAKKCDLLCANCHMELH